MHAAHSAEPHAASGTAASAAPPAPAGPDLLDGIDTLPGDLRQRLHDQLGLALLETRRAGESLVLILAVGVMVGIVLGAACLAAAGAGVVWIIETGVAPSTALQFAALVLLSAAAGGTLLIRRSSRALRFPATMRSFWPLAVTPGSTA